MAGTSRGGGASASATLQPAGPQPPTSIPTPCENLRCLYLQNLSVCTFTRLSFNNLSVCLSVCPSRVVQLKTRRLFFARSRSSFLSGLSALRILVNIFIMMLLTECGYHVWWDSIYVLERFPLSELLSETTTHTPTRYNTPTQTHTHTQLQSLYCLSVCLSVLQRAKRPAGLYTTSENWILPDLQQRKHNQQVWFGRSVGQRECGQQEVSGCVAPSVCLT